MSVPLHHRAGPSVYRSRAPHPGLRPVVAAAWAGRPGWVRDIRVLPDGCVDLVWDGRELSAVVTRDAALRVPLRSSWSAGLRLRCGVAGSLLGTSIADLPPGATPLRELWPEASEDRFAGCTTPAQALALLEDLVGGRAAEPDPVVSAAVSLLSGARVPALATSTGTSERVLRRRFTHEVGMSPKRLQRVLRLQAFLAGLTPATALAAAAAEHGYADQSHLGRETRRLTGSSPAELVRGRRLAETFQTSGSARPQDRGHELPADDRGAH
ncbi:helix-turn-helix domain-containing protein [Amycolatopsis tucumanensis]|uniref:helix-turn-helix domain-containing protein n=1 Tax=Amycolatopsis tucumanensis TaxID=401106 RepID=UPI003D73B25F